jgi:predicted phage tail protein
MRTIRLAGRLKKKFGGPFTMDVSSVQEAVRALAVNLPGFLAELRIGAYRITVGGPKSGMHISEDTLTFQLPEGKDIRIVPVTAGSKSGGTGKLIMGIALIAVATVASGGTFGAFAGGAAGGLGWGTVAMFGAAFTFAGIAQLLTPTPKAPNIGNLEKPEERPSFLMNTPVNVSSQGNPVPIVGGRCRVGSVVGSVGVSTERLA